MEGENKCENEAYRNSVTGECSGMIVVDNVLRRCEKVEGCLIRKIKPSVDQNRTKK